MTKIQIIVGSTRPGRLGIQIAEWVLDQAKMRGDAEYEIVDIADYNLGQYDEPTPPKAHKYVGEHTKKWAEKIDQADGYIFVAGEYNHSVQGSLKNALDFIFAEWNNKSLGLVTYGALGGVRAAEHLRQIGGELMLADVQHNTTISLHSDFENWATFKPNDALATALSTTLDQTVAWANALAPLRQK